MGLFSSDIDLDNYTEGKTRGTQKTRGRQTGESITTQRERQRLEQQQRTNQRSVTSNVSDETVRLLSPEVQKLLEQELLFQTRTPRNDADVARLRGFTEGIINRAQGAQAFANKLAAGTIREATRVGENEIQRQLTRLAGATGSSLSTGFLQAAASERSDLATRLGALRSDILLQGRQMQSQEYAGAGELLQAIIDADNASRGARTQGITALADALRGATQTRTGTDRSVTRGTATTNLTDTTTAVGTSKELNDIISTIRNRQFGQNFSMGTGSQTQSPSVIQGIGQVLDIFGGSF